MFTKDKFFNLWLRSAAFGFFNNDIFTLERRQI